MRAAGGAAFTRAVAGNAPKAPGARDAAEDEAEFTIFRATEPPPDTEERSIARFGAVGTRTDPPALVPAPRFTCVTSEAGILPSAAGGEENSRKEPIVLEDELTS